MNSFFCSFSFLRPVHTFHNTYCRNTEGYILYKYSFTCNFSAINTLLSLPNVKLTPTVSDSEDRDGTQECVFLVSSQVMLMIWRPHFKNHKLDFYLFQNLSDAVGIIQVTEN